MRTHPLPFLSMVGVVLLLGIACAPANQTEHSSPGMVWVASTPGDEYIKTPLAIPANTKVDFIRWELNLFPSEKRFTLNLEYGESQPNTLGFKDGGAKRSYEGTFTVSKQEWGGATQEVYQLSSAKFGQNLSLLKLNENLFHVLDAQNKLMVGNGGWSYTLNRKEPGKLDHPMHNLGTTSLDSALQVTFVGRTPCKDFAKEHNMEVSSACFKLKWMLTLQRDSLTRQPYTYRIRKVIDNVPRDHTGRWSLLLGNASNPHANLIQLDPDIPEKTISLLVVDENILFFLQNNQDLWVGNKDFSYTLNKKLQ